MLRYNLWLLIVVSSWGFMLFADEEQIKSDEIATLEQELVEELRPEIRRIEEKLESIVTIQITENPKGESLTLPYAVFRILKKIKIRFLVKKTKEMIPDIEDIKLSQVKARNMKAKSLLKSIVAARGLELGYTNNGIFLQKKQRRVLTQERRKQLKQNLQKQKSSKSSVETSKNEIKCEKCGDVISTYMEKKRKYCKSCWRKKATKRKIVVPKKSVY